MALLNHFEIILPKKASNVFLTGADVLQKTNSLGNYFETNIYAVNSQSLPLFRYMSNLLFLTNFTTSSYANNSFWGLLQIGDSNAVFLSEFIWTCDIKEF